MTVDSKFCPRCGGPLRESPPTRCSHCSYELFVNPRPTATIIVVRGSSYLALRRTIDPHRGQWELPGGFCDGWEHPAQAAVREAREELSVTVRLGEFVGMYVGSYEFQGETFPVLDCFWLAAITEGEIRLAPAEATEHAWLPMADPPDLAFDTMNRAIIDARKFV